MMDNFRVIYKVLRYLESVLDTGAADEERLRGAAYGITEERFKALMVMLADNGYVKGVKYRTYADGGILLDLSDVKITLRGLEYLAENSLMRKTAEALKGIKDIVPGI